MVESNKNRVILIVDDDAEDRMLLEEALEENQVKNTRYYVPNGEELMDYLYNRGKYSDKEKYSLPGLILLDLNMPKKDGREVLKEVKADPKLRLIPVVVLTTSKAEEDILKTLDLGANGYIAKPVSFASLVDLTKTISDYWFDLVQLPDV
ncbi:response regulator [Adhaeribacter rhizoryzae]|uniref:Response regulator n=1 Tax=Adhaeribacter rhizoryzae TaxID=2607907 RepID=A0A5M6D2J7_9BACT|nr:response regulator [Adhaeribacter rhizoryzae]KAA5541714.1 response regulator [Adhaeribacter rhizoryzae]